MKDGNQQDRDVHIITTNDCDDGLFAVYIKPDPNSPLAACPYLTEGEALPPPLTRNRTPTQIVHLVVRSRSVAHSLGCDGSPGGFCLTPSSALLARR